MIEIKRSVFRSKLNRTIAQLGQDGMLEKYPELESIIFLVQSLLDKELMITND